MLQDYEGRRRAFSFMSFGIASLLLVGCGDERKAAAPITQPSADLAAAPQRQAPIDTARLLARFRQRGGGDVFIKLTAEPTVAMLGDLAISGLTPPSGLRSLVTFDSLRIRTVWGHLSAAQVQRLAALPYVVRIESSEDEGIIYSTTSSIEPVNPNASEIGWNLTRVRAPDLWRDFQATGERQLGPSSWQSVGVAVLDEGGDYRQTYPAANWEFVSAHPASPANFTTDTTPVYLADHGTWVAGFVAAEPNNSMVAGVAPRAAVKFYKVLCSFHNTCTNSWGPIVAGLNRAYADGSAVVNMSFSNCGEVPPSTVHDAIVPFGTRVPGDAANPGVGVSLVASAGNGTQSQTACNNTLVGYPGAYTEVIAVGAINQIDQHPAGYSVGPKVELVAPGDCVDGLRVGGGVDACVSGTSFSAPHVSGLIAAIRALHNDWSADYVRGRLQGAASKISGQTLPRDDKLYIAGDERTVSLKS